VVRPFAFPCGMRGCDTERQGLCEARKLPNERAAIPSPMHRPTAHRVPCTLLPGVFPPHRTMAAPAPSSAPSTAAQESAWSDLVLFSPTFALPTGAT